MANLAGKVKAAIENDKRIRLAYLIGSRVGERHNPSSDVDLALIVNGGIDAFADIRSRVARTVGVFEDRVDVSDLSRADSYFKYKVITEGAKLLDRGHYDERMRAELSYHLPEANLREDQEVREWLNSPGGIDRKIVKRRLDTAHVEVAFLKRELLTRSTEGVVASDVYRRLLERSFHVVVESLLDVARHIVAVQGWGPARSYRDYVDILASKHVIPAGLTKRLVRAVEWRNIFVHPYLEIDHRRLLRKAKTLPRLAQEFRVRIAQFLRR